MIGYIIFICAISSAVICISYDTMARTKGWAIGEILLKDASYPKIASLITVAWVLIKSFIAFNWWSPILILITGWLLALFFTMILKKNVQILGLLSIFPMFILTVLYVSESRPCGFLHNLF